MESSQSNNSRLPNFGPIQDSGTIQTSDPSSATNTGSKSKFRHRRHLSHRSYLHAHLHNPTYLPNDQWVHEHVVAGADWHRPRESPHIHANLDGQRDKRRRLRPHMRHRSHDDRLSHPVKGHMTPEEIEETTTVSPLHSEPKSLGHISSEIADAVEMENVVRLPFVQRQESVHPEDAEKGKQLRKHVEKANLVALSSIADRSITFSQRLDTAYYNLLDRLSSIRSTISSFQNLHAITSNLNAEFNRETTNIVRNTRAQIANFHDFSPQIRKIDVLEGRMKTCREKALELDQRLEMVREQIEVWDRREMEWQKMVSRRLRIMWGIMGTAILLLTVVALVERFRPGPAPDGVLGMENMKGVGTHSDRNVSPCLLEQTCFEIREISKNYTTPFELHFKDTCQNHGTEFPPKNSPRKDPEEKIQRVLDEL